MTIVDLSSLCKALRDTTIRKLTPELLHLIISTIGPLLADRPPLVLAVDYTHTHFSLLSTFFYSHLFMDFFLFSSHPLSSVSLSFLLSTFSPFPCSIMSVAREEETILPSPPAKPQTPVPPPIPSPPPPPAPASPLSPSSTEESSSAGSLTETEAVPKHISEGELLLSYSHIAAARGIYVCRMHIHVSTCCYQYSTPYSICLLSVTSSSYSLQSYH